MFWLLLGTVYAIIGVTGTVIGFVHRRPSIVLKGALVWVAGAALLLMSGSCAHVETRNDRPSAFDVRPVKGVVAK